MFKHSKRRHSLLQGHLEDVIHTFELTSPKVSISLRFPIQKEGFNLYFQGIVLFSSLVRSGKLFRNCLTIRDFRGDCLNF